MEPSHPALSRSRLETLYQQYNRRECIAPDPLQFLYDFLEPADGEIVGLIAACLAFGTVKQILDSVRRVLEKMPEPCRWVRRTSAASMHTAFAGFRHRFVDGADLCDLLLGVRRVLARHGSLGACFRSCLREEDANFMPALTRFVDVLRQDSRREKNFLLPSPRSGSACKRLNLYLRWMVRRDEVDPGWWAPLPASKLTVPLDTHMHRIALEWGLTNRKQGNLRTAFEITEAFRQVAPDDPVRYDFCLTRLGMRKLPLS